MASASRESVSSQLDRLFREGTLTSLSDAQLLDRYLSARDEAAFEALVNLHGPMVLGLCRRLLRDPRDIEDAFQATFLVLIRKAPRIRDRGLLANWLYGVAYRVAVRARGNLLRRRERETSMGEIEPPARPDSEHPEEIPPILDQELNRLPARYRSPLVLCYLKGLTHDQAAEAIGCPVGTVRSRLARGRNLLKRRLTARGQVPPAVILGATLPSPAVPVPLVRATVAAAGKLVVSKGVLSAAAITAAEKLSEGVFPTMIGSRLKTIVLSLLALALTTSGVVGIMAVSSRRQRAKPPAVPSVTLVKKSDAGKTDLPPPKKIKPGDWLQIEVLEALPGRPISGTRIVRPDGTISLGFYGDVQVAGLDRNEIKVKVVNHLRKFLSDDGLGLFAMEEGPDGIGKPAFVTDSHGREVIKRINPIDCNRVFVDDSADQYAQPTATDEALGKIAEKLDQLVSRLDELLKAKTEEATKQDETKTALSAPATKDNIQNEMETMLRRKHPHRENAPPIPPPPEEGPSPFELNEPDTPVQLPPPEDGRPPFEPAEPGSLHLAELVFELSTAERAVAELEKSSDKSKAGRDNLAKARESFEAAKRKIPDVVKKAHGRLEALRAQGGEPKTPHVDEKFQSRLKALQSRLEEAKKLREEGKISEEEYRDAEGDYDFFSRPPLDEATSPFAEEMTRAYKLLNAEQELELAELLQQKYLSGPQKSPSKDAKPK